MQSSDAEILRASTPSEVLDGLQPLMSSAKSNCDGLLIESYSVPKFGPTAKYCYRDRHVVSIQRDGVAKAHIDRSPRIWYAGAVAICPIEVPQPIFSFRT
jgi:hypothetical protein